MSSRRQRLSRRLNQAGKRENSNARASPLAPLTVGLKQETAGANSLCQVCRETSRMDPAGLGEPTKGERHKTTPPVRRCRINRADPERDRRPRDPRSKPDNQESAQRSVQEEEPTASSASPSGTQIIRPLRPMRQTSLPGQARCTDCALKHRQTGLRSRVKVKLTAEQ